MKATQVKMVSDCELDDGFNKIDASLQARKLSVAID